ncbi:leucine-rich repeat neuronal protein 4 [Rhinophrynus dorsalis]
MPDRNLTEEILLLSTPESAIENPCNGLYTGKAVNLSLSNKGLQDFPPCLYRELEVLDLSINNLTKITNQDVSELSELLILDLKQNQIGEIYWTSEVLPNLEVLDLSSNVLSVIPKCIQLKKLKWLSLAQNIIHQIQPFAFSCFPNLEFLNLSSTLIPSESNISGGISQSAFAVKANESQESSTLKYLHVLDLSETFITGVNRAWSKDISNLKQLHIRKMYHMERLEDDLMKLFPQLELLNCAGSRALSSIWTGIFEEASNLKYLYLQNYGSATNSPVTKEQVGSLELEAGDAPQDWAPEMEVTAKEWGLEVGPNHEKLISRDQEPELFESVDPQPGGEGAGFGLTGIGEVSCNLTSFSPWNISADHLFIDLHGNPLDCSCELSWLFSDHVNITLIRTNETLCSNIQEGGLSVSLLQHHNQCQSTSTITVSVNEVITKTTIAPNHANISSSAETVFSIFQGPIKDPKNNMPVTQENEQKSFIPVGITVFKTSEDLDATTSLPQLQLAGSVTSSSSTSAGLASYSVTQDTDMMNTTGLASHIFTQDSPMTSQGGSAEFSSEKKRSTISPFSHFTIHPSLTPDSKDDPLNQLIEQSTNVNTQMDSSSQTEIPHDYEYEYEQQQEQEKTTLKIQRIPCDYNPCRHLQTPCIELQQLTQCFCPGLTEENVTPNPPRLRDVSEITDTSAQIHWCAPNSAVEKYQLMYHPEGSMNKTIVDNIYITTRKYTLYDLLPDTTYHICAISLNKAGPSDSTNDNLSRSPCTEFKTKPSHIIILAALSALAGVFLVAIAVLSVCLYKACKNNLVNQYDTHLVSYKNPAFDYQLNIPSYS